MKTADKQIGANRRNATKSTGPVSPGGKDLKEIYGWEGNWDWLYEKVAATLDDVCDESAATIRESLNRAGWSDDAIWQVHIDVCIEQIEAQKQTIQDLHKQKRDNDLAVQV